MKKIIKIQYLTSFLLFTGIGQLWAPKPILEVTTLRDCVEFWIGKDLDSNAVDEEGIFNIRESLQEIETLDAIDKKYRKESLKHHPDKNPEDPVAASNRLQKLTSIYNIIYFLKAVATGTHEENEESINKAITELQTTLSPYNYYGIPAAFSLKKGSFFQNEDAPKNIFNDFIIYLSLNSTNKIQGIIDIFKTTISSTDQSNSLKDDIDDIVEKEDIVRMKIAKLFAIKFFLRPENEQYLNIMISKESAIELGCVMFLAGILATIGTIITYKSCK